MTAQQARDEVLTAVAEAHPTAMDRALHVIETWAGWGEPFSANDTRRAMADAEVPTPVIGAAFLAAVTAGRIAPVDEVTSTDRGTHAKRIRRYLSAAKPPPGQSRADDGRWTPDHIAGQMTLEDAL